jgi:7,8-dihydropterin-6-yl-methyl-4-(beta-D-ribofuranosyl)aminobenzene 5'-phosphate synthase
MQPAEQGQNPVEAPARSDLTITVVHDNYPYTESLRTAWGFSALVTGLQKSILFDTGSDGALLLENMARLQVDPGRIEIVVLSHVHADHTGGLVGLLRANPRVQVYLPRAFPDRFKEVVRGYGAAVVEVNGPQEICEDVYTTGILGRRIQEQALVICTRRGLVVLTGCAHPGVTRIVETVRSLHEESILLVMGGFHLEWVTSWRMEKVAAALEGQGVRYVAPSHCTGERARQVFRKRYRERCLDMGVGRSISLAELC